MIALEKESSLFGISKDDIIFTLKKMDMLMQMDNQSIELCLIGGTACLLTGLITRATIDYDLLNLDYSPKVRNYLNFFQPYDLVDFEATTIPRSYKDRIHPVFIGQNVLCGILSNEDLILSKLCRNLEKDFLDIDFLIQSVNTDLLDRLICEVKADISSRYPRIQEHYTDSLAVFIQRYRWPVTGG